MYLFCTNLLLHTWINGPFYLLNLNALTGCFCCAYLDWKPLNHVECVLGKNVATDETKPFDQYQNLYAFVSKCSSL